jgi:hypothetical protein
MRDATETNEPLANRSATSRPRPAAVTVELRSFDDVFGTSSVSRAIALGSVAEALPCPLGDRAAGVRAPYRRAPGGAWRALARRTAALCAFTRSAFARAAASAPVAVDAAAPVPVVVAGVLGGSSTGAPRSSGPCPRRASAWAGSILRRVRGPAREPAPGGRGRVRCGGGRGGRTRAGEHAQHRDSARENMAVERTARGLQGHGASCPNRFVPPRTVGPMRNVDPAVSTCQRTIRNLTFLGLE